MSVCVCVELFTFLWKNIYYPCCLSGIYSTVSLFHSSSMNKTDYKNLEWAHSIHLEHISLVLHKVPYVSIYTAHMGFSQLHFAPACIYCIQYAHLYGCIMNPVNVCKWASIILAKLVRYASMWLSKSADKTYWTPI